MIKYENRISEIIYYNMDVCQQHRTKLHIQKNTDRITNYETKHFYTISSLICIQPPGAK